MSLYKIKTIKFIALIYIIIGISACGKPEGVYVKQPYPVPTFTNPVYDWPMINPSVLRTWDGNFFAYGSEYNWIGNGGTRLIPVLKSIDLVTWTLQGNAFNARPSWRSGTITSPDVFEIDKRPHMYVTIGNATDPLASIAVRQTYSPIGPFFDREDLQDMGPKPGNLMDADSTEIADNRHPFYFEDGVGGPKYIFWTSKNEPNQPGVYALRLSPNGLRIPDFMDPHHVASGNLEGVVIHKKDNYYYLFGTKVNGTESSIVVGRSTRLMGPYEDKNGGDLIDDASGSIFVEDTPLFKSSGHNTRIFTDKDNLDWVLFHSKDTRMPNFGNGSERKGLVLVKVLWNNGWPEIDAAYLSEATVTGPRFY